MASSMLLVITPMRDEAAHVERLARSMALQSRPPDAWILIDDGSADATLAKAREATSDLPFAEVVGGATDGTADPDRRLAVAAEAIAFNRALARVATEEFTLVGKLDADIELPPDWFERLEQAVAGEGRLGIVGGALEEPARGGWRRIRSPGYHVHGAVKLYRRECFEQIGGIRPVLGWDTIDETYARMHGWSTRTLDDLVARHHRPCGEAGSVLRGRARYGRCAYVVRYGAAWVVLRSFKVALSRPAGVSGAAFLWGYASAAVSRAPRVEDPAFARFVRAELSGRARAWLRRRPAVSADIRSTSSR